MSASFSNFSSSSGLRSSDPCPGRTRRRAFACSRGSPRRTSSGRASGPCRRAPPCSLGHAMASSLGREEIVLAKLGSRGTPCSNRTHRGLRPKPRDAGSRRRGFGLGRRRGTRTSTPRWEDPEDAEAPAARGRDPRGERRERRARRRGKERLRGKAAEKAERRKARASAAAALRSRRRALRERPARRPEGHPSARRRAASKTRRSARSRNRQTPLPVLARRPPGPRFEWRPRGAVRRGPRPRGRGRAVPLEAVTAYRASRPQSSASSTISSGSLAASQKRRSPTIASSTRRSRFAPPTCPG